MVDPLPWEIQHGEPDEAFRQFVFFREMPAPRKLGGYGLAERYELWRTWNWSARVAAYDEYLSDIAVREAEEALKMGAKQLAAEHMKELHKAREIFGRELNKMLEQSRKAGNTFMKPADVIRLGEFVVKNERLVTGEATERTEVHQDLSNLTDEDLAALEEIARKTGQVEE